MRMRNIWSVVLVLAVLARGAAAFGQPEAAGESGQAYMLEQVNVTAEKTEQDPQDIPASISVLSSGQIEDYGVDNTYRIFQLTPNLHMVKPGSGGGLAGRLQHPARHHLVHERQSGPGLLRGRRVLPGF